MAAFGTYGGRSRGKHLRIRQVRIKDMDDAHGGAPGLGYRNPPIVEAAIAIEYESLPQDRLSAIRKFAATISNDYPEQSARFQQEAQFQFGPVAAYASTQHEDGVVCASRDRKRFAQLALGSSVFSRLAPYGGWDEFERQAKPLWERFERALDVSPTILGVRYINRIEIPTEAPMEKFLRTYPEISRDLPQLIGPYFMKVEIPLESAAGGPMLTLQQGFVQSSSPSVYAILLDNDLRYPISSGTHVWDLLRLARIEKNRIFEACITDDLRRRLN